MTKYYNMASALRILSAETIEKANSGHPGLPLGMADVMTVLWSEFLKFDPNHSQWFNRDRFVLSAGHGSALLYSLLFLSGYKDVSIDDMKHFRQFQSNTAGHPEYGHMEGIETTTGPLGQGIATAVGMALGERMLNSRFGDDLINNKTYVLVGDGCLMEGISHEAIDFAGKQQLKNLIVLWDNNNITIEGEVSLASVTNQAARFEACGWDVISIDGHDYEAIQQALTTAQSATKPTMIACKTTIGKGAPTKAGKHTVHGAPLGAEELQGLKDYLNWKSAPFSIPEDILADWRQCLEKGRKAYAAWEATYQSKEASIQQELLDRKERILPKELFSQIQAFKKEHIQNKTEVASRKASNMILEVINVQVPYMIGGSADLTPSNLTKTTTQEYVFPETQYKGSYIDYGIREHLMGAMMNGLTLSGAGIAYGGAFMVFGDYARPAQRLAAIMEIAPIYVLTHDSIGVGEDGPTHQPVETLASMRSMPNFHTYRPADIIETAECWELVLQTKKTPSALALSRQNLSLIRTGHNSDTNLCAKGAYIIRGEEYKDDRNITILATGSEVSLATQAFDILVKEGKKVVVVSMPCMELFEKQDKIYQKRVLGEDNTARIGIEAGISYGWEKYLGSNGRFIGMGGFGASGKAEELFRHFGFTVENLVSQIKDML